jgi:hypothetical protein
MVFQIQLGHDYNAAPLTRRYISRQEDHYRDLLCKTTLFGNIPPSKT